ncbi:hypothetical protein BG011_000406 [Mortierella polycephala]|uniref:Hyaluronan/mRNA-binding protein domain-containing protein n=1 Tax=Mortierella polycephala TaxID=41804 RepID=A0A9P6Q713_9FUNG|nr:hypothetical protein BG011_000406 [Mortierella polycephala]
MTRTRTGDYKDPANAPRERRQSRNGYSDPRAIPKKAGAGHANWGVLGCELNQQEQTSAMSNTSASPTNESKIAVIDAETFSRLQNSSQNETTATNEESMYETESQ